MGVTSKPEVTVLPLPSPATPPPAPAGISNAPAGTASYCSAAGAPAGPAARERHVLIVASDGLWEWVSNAQAVGIASLAPTGALRQVAAAARWCMVQLLVRGVQLLCMACCCCAWCAACMVGSCWCMVGSCCACTYRASVSFTDGMRTEQTQPGHLPFNAD